MAGSATDYLENALLNHSLGVSIYAFSSNRWIALYTTAPTDSAAGSECVGYVRKSVVFNSASTGSSSNNTNIDFTSMPACTVVAFSIMDALSGGNILFYSTFPIPKVVSSGDTLRIPSGGITVSLD
jgi:hypothetical protein